MYDFLASSDEELQQKPEQEKEEEEEPLTFIDGNDIKQLQSLRLWSVTDPNFRDLEQSSAFCASLLFKNPDTGDIREIPYVLTSALPPAQAKKVQAVFKQKIHATPNAASLDVSFHDREDLIQQLKIAKKNDVMFSRNIPPSIFCELLKLSVASTTPAGEAWYKVGASSDQAVLLKANISAMKLYGESQQAIMFWDANGSQGKTIVPCRHQLHILTEDPYYDAFRKLQSGDVIINTGQKIRSSNDRDYHSVADGHIFFTPNLKVAFPDFKIPIIHDSSVHAPYAKIPMYSPDLQTSWDTFEKESATAQANGMTFVSLFTAKSIESTRGANSTTRWVCAQEIPFGICNKQCKWNKETKLLACDGPSSNLHGAEIPKQLTSGEMTVIFEDSEKKITAFSKPNGLGELRGRTRSTYKTIHQFYEEALNEKKSDKSAKDFAVMKKIGDLKKGKIFLAVYTLRKNSKNKAKEQGLMWMERLKVRDFAMAEAILKEDRFPWDKYFSICNFSWNPKIVANSEKAALNQFEMHRDKKNKAWEAKQRHGPKRTRFF